MFQNQELVSGGNLVKRFNLLIIACVFFSQTALAEYYEREGNYVYRIQPYKELWSSVAGVKLTAKIAQSEMFRVLSSLQSKRILPEAIMSSEDLENYRKYQTSTDDLVNHLNEFVREQRERGAELEGIDLIPSAIVLLVGGKVSIGVGKGIGASGSIGWVIMPVRVEKINALNGKVEDEYVSIRSSVVVWPALDAGLGLGGGMVKRVGVAAVWGNDSFVRPEQFWGGGVAGSWSPITVGVGANFKVGTLFNWSVPTRFIYAMASADFGPSVEVGALRVNASVVTSAPAVLGMFDRAAEQAFNLEQRESFKRFDRWMKENGPTPKKSRSSDDEDNADVEIPATPAPENKRR